jgi:hypothetical protein
MAHAAGLSGHPVEIFKRAKELGSPGFKGSRVCPELVLKFVTENADQFTAPAGADLKQQKLAEEVRKLRLANDTKEGKYVLRSAVIESCRKTLPAMNALLEQKLCNELVSVMPGLSPDQARPYAKKLLDQILAEFESFRRFWEI